MKKNKFYSKIFVLFIVILTFSNLNAQVVSPELEPLSVNGTTDFIAKWISTSTLGNSIMKEINNEIRLLYGIPPFDVAIDLWAGSSSWKIQHTYDGQSLDFIRNGVRWMYLDIDGNVNINVGNSTSRNLYVNGNVHASSVVLAANVSANNAWINNKITAAEVEVAGKVHAQEIEVSLEAGSGADFVFEENYILRDLNEVEEYILQNHHLPDIPSAVEMQENGLNVSDFQLQLLQKIEELTLYIIKLEKQNTDLFRRVHKLEKL